MHDDSALRAEPGVQVGNARDAIAFKDHRPGAGLHQMLRHVTLEVRQQLHLLLQLSRVAADREVAFLAFLVDEVNVAAKIRKLKTIPNLAKLISTHIPLDNMMSLVVSLNMTPMPSSQSWYPKPYLSL